MKTLFLSLAIAAALHASAFACFHDCHESEAGLRIIRHFEGFFPFTYDDIAGHKSIGFGHKLKPGEHFDEPLMGPEADELLRSDIRPAEDAINRLVHVSLRQPQFDAVGSFTFNLGQGTLANSTLLRLVNADQHQAVPPQFLRYGNARVNGVLRPVRGLIDRRAAEAELYAQPDGAPECPKSSNC
jgi:lysozyme